MDKTYIQFYKLFESESEFHLSNLHNSLIKTFIMWITEVKVAPIEQDVSLVLQFLLTWFVCKISKYRPHMIFQTQRRHVKEIKIAQVHYSLLVSHVAKKIVYTNIKSLVLTIQEKNSGEINSESITQITCLDSKSRLFWREDSTCRTDTQYQSFQVFGRPC